jgi:hypothetical protein
MKSAPAVTIAVLAAIFSAAVLAGEGQDNAALARVLKQAAVPLEAGLAASSREGIPISAKFEIEDDDANELQLSVYTMKRPADGFDFEVDFVTGDVTMKNPTYAEVIVDHATGKIGKVVPINDGEDLAAAKNEGKAIALAKRSLEAATAQAVKSNQGYRAVSAMPDLRDGRPFARVLLVNGSQWKTVYESLDQEQK